MTHRESHDHHHKFFSAPNGDPSFSGRGRMRDPRFFGPPGLGDWRGRGSRRGPRGRRGDVRLAILHLLKERSMHGYEMLQELDQRTQGFWKPSPGSLYPALQLLEDEGLIRSVEVEGRRSYELTDEGRTQLDSDARPAPWEALVNAVDQGDLDLGVSLRQLHMAIGQVAEAGSSAQKAKVHDLLAELRRQVYLVLAEDPSADAPKSSPAE